jgi:DNA-binding response OmpR family regulator
VVAPTRILVVEDEHDIAQLIKHTLERGGDAHVDVVGSGDAALKAVKERPPDLMILDLNVADFDAVSITVDGTPVRLTRREFELLRCLLGNRNRVLSRERLLELVWGYEHFVETRSVDVHVGRLRSKLGPAGTQIETVVGLGYRFVE